jgi:DNA-directed RNA polymerase specialized sigma24 family protein
MNQIELMQGELSALSRRVARLEEVARAQAVVGVDGAEAGRLAQQLGFEVEILVLPERMGERRALALQLRARGWSYARIARVLACDEKTVRRWA